MTMNATATMNAANDRAGSDYEDGTDELDVATAARFADLRAAAVTEHQREQAARVARREAYERVTGSKYEATKDLDLAAVAKLVRADIAAAKKAGELPRTLKASVAIKRYSMGQNMTITASGVAENAETTGTLQNLMEAYNRRVTQSVSDYSNVQFYAFVRWDA